MINEPFTLGNRTLDFSKKVLVFCRNEKLTAINRSIVDQLIRSATSIGANYAEANNAASKTDFRNKIYIAKKETAETKYWLNLMNELCEDKQTCSELLGECHSLLMIFQKIISTLNHKKSAYSTVN